jgi:hypothetical protein
MEATLEMSHLSEWFSVRFDDIAIALRVDPPGAASWQTRIAWKSIIRVCFQAGDLFESDAVYIFTDEQPESYAIPIEADGGQALWFEILGRNLFDAEMAIAAAMATNELFCYPLPDRQIEAEDEGPEDEGRRSALLTGPGQLPELEGGQLVLTWDQIEVDSIILHEDRVIWREKTGWEVYERFEEIASILKEKYGKRLVDIIPTPRSLYALYGDSTRGYFHVTFVRESLDKDG